MFDGDETLALAGYNAGPYRIKKLWAQAGSGREFDQFLEELLHPFRDAMQLFVASC